VTVADDDLASCGRRIKTAGLNKSDPFEILAEAYFKMPPCSTKDSPSSERLESIIGKVEKSGSKGVIFNLVKFCEPELFDAPFLVDQLKARGTPALVIDSEVNQGMSGQLKTRLEAFVEMIS
jgi:benzoyl-CoA reductase/2-hydroxyglutaryl-CoA dehydratase subunit BcrC/BadD/HgdB